MKYLTSLNPNDRIEHQRMCVDTWFAAGASEVLAVQTAADDLNLLQQQFPRVQFEQTEKTGVLFDRPYLPSIYGMLDFAAGNTLLINSDIEVRLSPSIMQQQFAVDPKVMRCFVRWDYNGRRQQRPIKWGIDAFMLTHEIISALPDDGMTIGCPVWDWWLPWLACRDLGLKVSAWVATGFMHRAHVQNWPESQMQVGFRVMQERYGISKGDLAQWILQETKRTKYASIQIRP